MISSAGCRDTVTDMGQCNPDRLHFADAYASGRILAEYVYSASGNPVVKKIGGNITSTYAYDELLNIKALKTETEKQTLANNHYFYDGNGNQIRREGLEGTTGYAYDGRNRLTEISYPSALGGYTEKLGYDAAGNRIRRETEQEITTYRYDNCNRLQELRREYKNAETSTAQPQIIRYTYDRQGNMLSEGEKKYSYDSFGRMVRAEVPVEHRGASNQPDEHAGFSNAAQSTGETFGIQENSSATREFQVQINRYDGEGLRHEMEENGRLIKFLYNEDREVVAEETGNGTITRYIRGLGIISSDSEEAKTYYHYVSDEQGSITYVLPEDAEILNHYSYDAFGNIIEKTEKVENRFCYNGEMLDPVTQQYYLRARFYNPVIGRFTQEDTYYGDGLNLYQYCQANPVGYVDPSGHICEIVQNHYEQYQEYRKQHPRATAAETYEAVTGKNPLKKDAGKSGSTTINGLNIIDGKVDGKIPLAEYEKYRVDSVHNIGSDTMTLGKYEPTIRADGTKDFSVPGSGAYTVKAGDTTYFSLGTEWDKITDTYGLDAAGQNMFDYFNKPALDDAVSAGKKIRFSHNPEAYGECALKWEWDYLQEKHGYFALEKKGDFWYATK